MPCQDFHAAADSFPIRYQSLYLQIDSGADPLYRCQQLAEGYRLALNTPDLRCVVITGIGDTFYPSCTPQASGYEPQLLDKAQAECRQLFAQISVPIILAINGHCFGEGLHLLLEADLAIATEDAQFGFSQNTPGALSILELCPLFDQLPKKQLLCALYSGTPFDAQLMMEHGLLNKIVPKDQLNDTVEQFVSSLLDKPFHLISIERRAYREMKHLTLPLRREYGMQLLREVFEVQAPHEKQ